MSFSLKKIGGPRPKPDSSGQPRSIGPPSNNARLRATGAGNAQLRSNTALQVTNASHIDILPERILWTPTLLPQFCPCVSKIF